MKFHNFQTFQRQSISPHLTTSNEQTLSLDVQIRDRRATDFLPVFVRTIPRTIKGDNTSDLIDKIKNYRTPCKLVSYDVNSLFTKVPI